MKQRILNKLCVEHETVLSVGGHDVPHAKNLVVVDPDESVIKQYEDKASEHNTLIVLPKAVVFDQSVTVPLFSTKENKNRTTIAHQRRITKEVPAVNLYQLCEEYRPQVLVMDVPGLEYSFLKHNIPDSISQIALRIYLYRPDWKKKAQSLLDVFSTWQAIKKPTIGKSWSVTGVWTK